MKVLAVSASPRKGGNSDVLCDQLLKGASENGNDVEKIMIDRCLPGAKEKGIIYGTEPGIRAMYTGIHPLKKLMRWEKR